MTEEIHPHESHFNDMRVWQKEEGKQWHGSDVRMCERNNEKKINEQERLFKGNAKRPVCV